MSLILRCPHCEKHYEGAAEALKEQNLICPLCGELGAASDFSVMMFCPHCRSKLAISLDMMQEQQLVCPRCNNEFAPSIVISLDDDIDDDPDIFDTPDPEKFMFEPGDFFDKYEIIRLLGKGGMGEVYLARHLLLNRDIALKVMLPEVAGQNSIFAKRFIREAKLASKIASPNLISVFDVGSDSKTESLFIAMEYVDGYNLSEIIRSTGALSEADTLNIIAEVLNALEAMELHNVVHRDIKPSNIMIDVNGAIKLADLGIAKSSNHAEGELTLTHGNAVFGTPNYASPEQCRAAHNVDCRADIYSLGATMYHMVTGKPPYDGETAFEIMLKVFNDPIPDLRNLPVDLTAGFIALVNDMMAKDPADRPQNIAELRVRVENIRNGEYKFSDRIKDMIKLKTGIRHGEKTAFIQKTREVGWSLLKKIIALCIIAAVTAAAFFFGIRLRDKLRLTEPAKDEDIEIYVPPAAKKKSIAAETVDLKKIAEDEAAGFKFSANKKMLLRAPADFKGDYRVPKGVSGIGSGAFADCRGLENVYFSADVVNISSRAFYGCSNLKGCYSIGQNKIVVIGNSAFALCKNLQNAFIGSNVSQIGNDAFAGCESLRRVSISRNVSFIGYGAFRDCTNLEQVSFDVNIRIQKLGDRAFANCRSLREITIPAKLEGMNSNVFDGCSSLRKIFISNPIRIYGNNIAGIRNLIEETSVLVAPPIQTKAPAAASAPAAEKAEEKNFDNSVADAKKENVSEETSAPVDEKKESISAVQKNTVEVKKEQKTAAKHPELQKIDYNKLAAGTYDSESIIVYPVTIDDRLKKFEQDLQELRAQQKKAPYNKWLKARVEVFENIRRNLLRQQNNRKKSISLKNSRRYNVAATKKLQDLFYAHSIKRTDWGYSGEDVKFAEELLRMVQNSNVDPNVEVKDGRYARLSGSLLKAMLDPRGIPSHVANKIVTELVRHNVCIDNEEGKKSKFLFLNKDVLAYGVDDLSGFLLQTIKFRRNKDMINLLINCGANVNEKDDTGNSILHYAVRMNDVGIIRNLLLAGSDVTAVNKEQQTPLFIAYKYAGKPIIDLLIAAGSDAGFKDFDGKTASYYKYFGDFNTAINRNQIYQISNMLRKHPDLANEELAGGMTPLQYAAKNKNLAMVKVLLSHKADPDKKGKLVQYGYAPVQYVYDLAYYLRRDSRRRAERVKMLQIFTELVKAGADIRVNPMGYGGYKSLLNYSLRSLNEVDTIAYNYISVMLRYSDIKQDMPELLESFFRRYRSRSEDNNNQNIIENVLNELLKFSSNVSEVAFNRIFVNAVQNIYVSDRELEILLKHVPDINCTYNGQTALYAVCRAALQVSSRSNMQTEYAQRVKFLLRKGAKVDSKNTGYSIANLNLPPEIRNIPEIKSFLARK